MTLAILVAVMTASSVKKLPKVICPIENDKDRIRCKTAANTDMVEIYRLQSPIIYDVIKRRGNLPARAQRRYSASFQADTADFWQVVNRCRGGSFSPP